MIDHKDVVSLASLGLDGCLSADSAAHLAEHVRNCRDCTVYAQQLATTKALLSAKSIQKDDQSPGRAPRRGPGRSSAEDGSAQNHQVLVAVARASDPAHADDLVQEVWDHYLGRAQGALPNRGELLEYLLQHLDEHQRAEDSDSEVWADSLLNQHRHNPADLDELDLPPDSGAQPSLRELADLDQLDADADAAELFYPDFYDDGAGGTTWSSPPTAWPTLSRILGPDAELSTEELYSKVDAAFDELPEAVADVVNLVDVEGHSLERAMSLFALSRRDAERNLVIGRNHLRGRISTYLAADPPM
jgi:DNA-directed RNA polymerase specialized sigma24 family protein